MFDIDAGNDGGLRGGAKACDDYVACSVQSPDSRLRTQTSDFLEAGGLLGVAQIQLIRS